MWSWSTKVAADDYGLARIIDTVGPYMWNRAFDSHAVLATSVEYMGLLGAFAVKAVQWRGIQAHRSTTVLVTETEIRHRMAEA